MKTMKKNKKETKKQIEKHAQKHEKTGDQSQSPRRLASRVVLCLCVFVLICSSCALFTLHLSNGWKQTTAKPSASDKIRIYVDQGHNPSPHHNKGAQGNGLYEQDLTFGIGILLAELLEADGRFEVCLSRPDESTVLGSDTASSLAARVNGAAEFQADYFVSLHVNAYTEDAANGIEVFVPAGDRESYAVGNAMLRGMVEATGLNNRGMKQSDELYVLKNTEMPAVLLEMGFISNAEDAALLSEHPELFAQGIYHGIVEYFEPADTARPSVRLWMIAASTALVVGVVALLWRTKRTRSEDQA